MKGVQPGQIDVYKAANADGAFVAILAETGEWFADMTPEPDGWWRVSTAWGRVRGMWVRPGVDEPWRDIVNRLLGG